MATAKKTKDVKNAAGCITLTIEGSEIDGGHVRLSDLIIELEAVKEALRQTERSLFHDGSHQLHFRVVDASHSSPLQIVIESVPNEPNAQTRRRARSTVSHFVKSVGEIKRKRRPANFDLMALESLRDLANPLSKHVERIAISAPTGKVIPIDIAYRENANDVIGPDEFSLGSISGKLERVNVHNVYKFEIFPTVGPVRVICNFADNQLGKVLGAVKSYVTVTGKLFYKCWAPFAHEIDVHNIDIHEMNADLPSFDDIRGIAPFATGELSSEDFVSRMRDEDW